MNITESKPRPASAVRKYLSFFRIRFVCGLQYRAAAYAGIATQFAWGFGETLLYSAFYASGDAATPMELSQMCSYIWMRQAFLGLFMSWYFDPDILEMITSGSVAYELCRPCDLYSMWFVKNIALRSSRCALRCLPILAVAFFLPEPIRMTLPDNFLTLLLFFVSLLLGAMVTVAFSMLIYTSIFHTVSALGVRLIAVNIVAFASGELIPLPFMPPLVRKILEFSPFGAMQNSPYMIYSGVTDTADAVFAIGLQLLWLVVMVAVGKLWLDRSVKRVVVQGG